MAQNTKQDSMKDVVVRLSAKDNDIAVGLAVDAFALLGQSRLVVDATLSRDAPESLQRFDQFKRILLMAFQQGKAAAQSAVVPDGAQDVPTTYMERFRSALCRMCGAMPPEDICQEWLDHKSVDGVDRLQMWVGSQAGTPNWAQCIVTIEAAMMWADEPTEGVAHEMRD